jgi:hypothetical protein
MAVQYNVEIDQGADWFLNVTYEQPQGTPVNITGYTSALQLRSLPTDTTAVLSLSTGSGITITGSTGLVAVHATAAQTRAIDEGVYYYDLEITSQSGIVTRLVQGQAYVSAEVTR